MNTTNNLLVTGHTIEELIELFSDPIEQKDLYVNTALVQPDFILLIKALNAYKLMQEIVST